jgi:hypothetical protein
MICDIARMTSKKSKKFCCKTIHFLFLLSSSTSTASVNLASKLLNAKKYRDKQTNKQTNKQTKMVFFQMFSFNLQSRQKPNWKKRYLPTYQTFIVYKKKRREGKKRKVFLIIFDRVSITYAGRLSQQRRHVDWRKYQNAFV